MRYRGPMFGRKFDSPVSTLLSPALVQLIAISSIEVKSKNAAAREIWGVGKADRWSADLGLGEITFYFQDRPSLGQFKCSGLGPANQTHGHGVGQIDLCRRT